MIRKRPYLAQPTHANRRRYPVARFRFRDNALLHAQEVAQASGAAVEVYEGYGSDAVLIGRREPQSERAQLEAEARALEERLRVVREQLAAPDPGCGRPADPRAERRRITMSEPSKNFSDTPPRDPFQRLLWMNDRGLSVTLTGGVHGPWECAWTVTPNEFFRSFHASPAQAIESVLRQAGINPANGRGDLALECVLAALDDASIDPEDGTAYVELRLSAEDAARLRADA